MNVEEIVEELPFELKLVVLYFMVRAPKVHFLKPFKHFNGGLRKIPLGFPGIWGQPHGEPGVEEVSPLSGANKIAKLLKDMSAVSKKISLEHLTSIAMNPIMFPIDQVRPGVPHVKVDLVNDVFCVSSNGQGPNFPGERFTCGVALFHEKLKDMHRVCVALPNYDLAAQAYGCQDCDKNYRVDPNAFVDDRIEFCFGCIGLWFGQHPNLEQVYIIVPGLPRAQRTDKHHIYRYGDGPTVCQAHREALQRDPTSAYVWGFSGDVNNTRESGEVIAIQTIEGFGAGGPCSFDGDGITMYEVAAPDVPAHAVQFLEILARSYMGTRVFLTNLTMGTSPPVLPEDPRVCGGMVEFKFLSFSLDS